MLNLLEVTEGATGMEALWTGVTSVISNLMTLMGTVTTGLLSNNLFIITLGVVLFGIIFGIVFTLVRKIRKRGK